MKKYTIILLGLIFIPNTLLFAAFDEKTDVTDAARRKKEITAQNKKLALEKKEQEMKEAAMPKEEITFKKTQETLKKEVLKQANINEKDVTTADTAKTIKSSTKIRNLIGFFLFLLILAIAIGLFFKK